ncbi:MAG: hypothetical protein HGA44_02075 [Cellulomonadaceae bacterium]|nr:hypothetical protein [Cellulomonadaceae bacterium]
MSRAGMLSIESKNVFAILKTWLYAEQDVVLRELVSNASDAIGRRREVEAAGGLRVPRTRGRIDVVVDATARTLTIADDGIGMTADEVDRFINQIAFSGAAEFVQTHRDDDAAMIGRFGVGFYSAFMLSDRVVIETLSHETGAVAVRWEGTGDMGFRIGSGTRSTPGTSVVLDLAPDATYLNGPDLARVALRRFFAFLPTEVRLTFVPADGDSAEGACVDELVNTPDPVWRRPAGSVTTQQMNAFYREHFDDVCDPLFWIRIDSVDLGLRGIVFVRDTKNGTEQLDGRFDVLSRGVFVEQNPAALIPRFVNLQHGILECDDLPLVVSRSSTRGASEPDGLHALVNECLTQEVTIRLNTLATTERATYEQWWPQIGPFVKYGVLTDKIFASVMARKVLFEDLDGARVTIAEHLAARGAAPQRTIHYTSDPLEQALYVAIFRRNQIPALVLDHVIDQPLMRAIELLTQGVRFRRLDADLAALFTLDSADSGLAHVTRLTSDLAAVLGERAPGFEVAAVHLRHPDVAVLVAVDEGARRVDDMAELYGLADGTGPGGGRRAARTLLVNLDSPVVAALVGCADPGRRDLGLEQLVDVALLMQGDLGAGDVPALVDRLQLTLTRYLATP